VLREIDFLLKEFADGSKLFTFVETSNVNKEMCKFEASREESRAQSANSSNA